MSQSKIKKIKQMARREITKNAEELIGEFRTDLIGLAPINPKPKYVPKRVWKFIVLLVIKKAFFKKWYGVDF